MNNEKSLSINCNVGLTVTREQAERCLRILEMYLNDNPQITILCNRKEIFEKDYSYTKHYMYLERRKEGK